MDSVTSTESSSSLLRLMYALKASQKAETTDTDTSTTTKTASNDDSSKADNCFASGSLSFDGDLMSLLMQAQQQTNPADQFKQDFAELDTDSSGGLSKAEFEASYNKATSATDSAKADKVFAKLDGDGDGNVTETEVKSALERAHPQGGPHHAHGGGKGFQDAFAELDTDGDGSVSQTEFQTAYNTATSATDSTAASSLFSTLDTDGDGSVTETEMKTALEKNRPHGPPPPQQAEGGSGFEELLNMSASAEATGASASLSTSASIANTEDFLKAIKSYLTAQNTQTDLTPQLTSIFT